MSPFLLLVKLRLLDVLRRPIAGFFILVLPVILLLVIGGIFANGHPFERRRVSVVWDARGADAARERALESMSRLPGVRIVPERTEAIALGGLTSRMTDAVIVAPAQQGSEAEHQGSGAGQRGSGAGQQGSGAGQQGSSSSGVRLLVRQNDELFGRGLAAAIPGVIGGAGVAMEIVPAPRWGYLHYLMPGMLALAVVLTGLYGMGYTMVRYRATQFLKKLSTTPLSKTTFVGAQIAARAALVLAQSVLMLLAARLVFGMPLSLAAFCWMLALTTLGLLTFMGAGFALACVIKSEGNIQDFINAITGPLVLLSEIFFSAEELPGPLPWIAAALPSTQLVRLSRAVLLQGDTQAAALLPGIAIMTAWLVATFATALLVFRWNE